jgi:hypothetical protein
MYYLYIPNEYWHSQYLLAADTLQEAIYATNYNERCSNLSFLHFMVSMNI